MMHWIAVLVIVALVSSASCSREEKADKAAHETGIHGMAADWKFTLPPGDPEAGRKLFVEVECYKCHEVKGETFPAMSEREKGIGPELSQMAGMHPLEFFAESIINPNVVIDPKGKELNYIGGDGKSKMPDYSNVLTVKQVTDLATYLASLKGQEHKGH